MIYIYEDIDKIMRLAPIARILSEHNLGKSMAESVQHMYYSHCGISLPLTNSCAAQTDRTSPAASDVGRVFS